MKPFEPAEVLKVPRDKNEVVRPGNGRNLAIHKRGRRPQLVESRALLAVPGGRFGVIGKDRK